METSQTKRVNITLPSKTLAKIDRVTSKGNRSRFISQAVDFYIGEVGRKKLRMTLKEGAVKRSRRDLDVTKDWFFADEEIWRKNVR